MKPGLHTYRYNRPSDSIWRFRGYRMIGPHFLHRIVYTLAHGFIPKDWVIHHIDGDKLNNDIDNLIAIPDLVHELIHTYPYKLNRDQCEKVLKDFQESADKGI